MAAVVEALSESCLWGGVAVILVLIGTNPYPFTRLLDAVNAWAIKSGENVIAQTGHSPIADLNIRCYPFVSHEQIRKWIEEAELVICQGGMGSLRDCIAAGKKIVAVPRRPEFGECKDNQAELVEALAQEGKVVALMDVNELPHAIESARRMIVRRGNQSIIPRLVADKINSILGRV